MSHNDGTIKRDEKNQEADSKVVQPIELIEDSDEQVWEMLVGYTDKDGVTHKEFTLREITGRDEEAIHSNKNAKNNGSRIASLLLSRCVTSIGTMTQDSMGKQRWEDIIKDLYVGDQDYMLMQLRKISLGEEIEISHVCPNPECKATLNTVVEIDELEIVPFSGTKKVPFELPKGFKDKKGIHKHGTIAIPTGLDREILTPLTRSNMARAETAMLTRLCKFDDGTLIDDEAMGSLSIKDRKYLQELLKDNYFGYDLDLEIVCDSCGEIFRGSLNTSNFI